MKLNLLDINKFIEKNNIQKITSSKYQLGEKKIDSQGLFSEEIFGRIASNERKTRFGYIDLKTKIIHPEAWDIICGIDPTISKLLNNNQTFILSDTGTLVASDTGNMGVNFFCTIIDQLNYDKFKKKENVNFLKTNRDKILIDKFLVWPAGIRDVQISRTTDFIKMESAEINKLYIKLINQSKSIPDDITFMPLELSQLLINNIQRTCLEINTWIKNRMKGKTGLIRGGSLNKSTDYSARLIIVPDPKLKIGMVGLPWQVILKLFEPFTIHHILFKNKHLNSEIKELIKSDVELDVNTIKRFISKINDNPDMVPLSIKELLIELANIISTDKLICYKRDPVENRDSWVSANIKVNSKGFVMKIPPLDCARNGADFDGDTMAVFPLFSKEATEEAKQKLHPRYNLGNWSRTSNLSSLGYTFELDIIATIYRLTEK